MNWKFNTIEDIKKNYGVKSHKETREGLIAIRKSGMWLYFGYYVQHNSYMMTGSTLRLER